MPNAPPVLQGVEKHSYELRLYPSRPMPIVFYINTISIRRSNNKWLSEKMHFFYFPSALLRKSLQQHGNKQLLRTKCKKISIKVDGEERNTVLDGLEINLTIIDQWWTTEKQKHSLKWAISLSCDIYLTGIFCVVPLSLFLLPCVTASFAPIWNGFSVHIFPHCLSGFIDKTTE